MLYRVHLAWARFELTILVVIGTGCICSSIYKSNYHTIMITTAPNLVCTCICMLNIHQRTQDHMGKCFKKNTERSWDCPLQSLWWVPVDFCHICRILFNAYPYQKIFPKYSSLKLLNPLNTNCIYMNNQLMIFFAKFAFLCWSKIHYEHDCATNFNIRYPMSKML